MLSELVPIVRRAGEHARSYFDNRSRLTVDFKNPRDLVTQADREVEQRLRRDLAAAFDDVAFLGEEGGASDRDNPRQFVADPIDGTTNFVHGYPFYAVSLAYRAHGVAECALVYAPSLDQLFTAARGQGAQLNGTPVTVSDCDQLGHALAATGFACVRDDVTPNSLPLFNHMIYRLRDIHRDGSAALDLCYVAAGIYDLFWERNLNPWDTAAGALILAEAGGRLSAFDGGHDYEARRELVAANPRLHAAALAEIAALQSAGSPG